MRLVVQSVLIACCLCGFLVASCGIDNDPQPVLRNAVTVADGILASYEVLSAQGEPGTSFPEGENIRLAFSVQNNTSDTIYLPPWTFPMDSTDFFSLYKIDGAETQPQNVGRAINDACCLLDLGRQPVFPNTTVHYIMPWRTNQGERVELPIIRPHSKPTGRFYAKLGQSNSPLVKGNYRSSFIMTIMNTPTPFSISFRIH